MRIPRTTLLFLLALMALDVRADDYFIVVRNLRQKGPYLISPESTPWPAYPRELILARIRGYVDVRFHVQGGSVAETAIEKSSQKEFADAVREAVAKWTFVRPGQHTKPADSFWITCTIEFRIEEDFPLPGLRERPYQ